MSSLEPIKKRLAPWFKERGFISNSGKRIWYKDNGFYLIVAEIQPLHGFGFYINLGVKFLWSEPGAFWDYNNNDDYGSGRVLSRSSVFHALIYDYSLIESAPRTDFEEEFAYVLNKADLRIKEYENLKHVNVLLEKLPERRACINNSTEYGDYCSITESYGIAKLFSGDKEGAKYTFINEYASERIIALLPYIDNLELFRTELIKLINEYRCIKAEKSRIKLDNITSLFDE